MIAPQVSWRSGALAFLVMGASMAGHLMSAGHRLVLHTRTRSRAQPLLDRGATWADSPVAAAEGADIAISMVGTPRDVEQTHLEAGGTLQAHRPPRIIIDMTTSRPSLALRMADEAAKRGVGSLDAPVSGGDIGALRLTLVSIAIALLALLASELMARLANRRLDIE